jgi:hypothetical protein
MGKKCWPGLGGICMVVAKKEILPVKPVKLKKPLQKVAGSRVLAEPRTGIVKNERGPNE